MASLPTSHHALWRLAFAGLVLPTAFVAVDHLLLAGLSGAFRTDWLMVVTMAVFVFQIGLMGVVCGNLTDWPKCRWVLYGWCWLLIDFQTLIAWAFAEHSWWISAFQASSLLASQLGLAAIWAVLGTARWTIRWPVSLVLIVLLLLPLLRFQYWSENAALLFAVQLFSLGGICLALRRRGYRLIVADSEHARNQPPRAATGFAANQFGLRDLLVWTTALALICGVVRAVGFPIEQWLAHRYYSPIPLLAGGFAVGIALVVALWAGLGTASTRFRWSLLLFAIPAIGTLVAVINWLEHLRQYRPWTARWAIGRPWWDWAFWSWLFDYERYTVAWICLAGGMLFATLLFPRALGYRLRKQVPSIKS